MQEFFGLKHTSIVIPKEERPVCQRCCRALRLLSRWYYYDLYSDPGPHLSKSFSKAIKHAKAWSTVDVAEDGKVKSIYLWMGDFYGWGRDNAGVPLFCTHGCALVFAVNTYNNGQRMVRDGIMITRESAG